MARPKIFVRWRAKQWINMSLNGGCYRGYGRQGNKVPLGRVQFSNKVTVI